MKGRLQALEEIRVAAAPTPVPFRQHHHSRVNRDAVNDNESAREIFFIESRVVSPFLFLSLSPTLPPFL